jgi:hypothetical protein
MHCEKQTDKALLMVRDGISFWIQKRWLRADWSLTAAGWKAYHIARRSHSEHLEFDALKEFELARETEKAVLLRCAVAHPDGTETRKEFWLPKMMTVNWGFVNAKIKEIEKEFPFVDTHVRWSGNNARPQGRDAINERGSVWK